MNAYFCNKMLCSRIILSDLPLVQYFDSNFQLLLYLFVLYWVWETLFRSYLWSNIVWGLAGGLIQIEERNFRVVINSIINVGVSSAHLDIKQFDLTHHSRIYVVPKEDLTVGSFSQHFRKAETLENFLLNYIAFQGLFPFLHSF